MRLREGMKKTNAPSTQAKSKSPSPKSRRGVASDAFERHIVKLAPDATHRAFAQSVEEGGAVIAQGNAIIRVTVGGNELLKTIKSPYSPRQFAPSTTIKIK